MKKIFLIGLVSFLNLGPTKADESTQNSLLFQPHTYQFYDYYSDFYAEQIYFYTQYLKKKSTENLTNQPGKIFPPSEAALINSLIASGSVGQPELLQHDEESACAAFIDEFTPNSVVQKEYMKKSFARPPGINIPNRTCFHYSHTTISFHPADQTCIAVPMRASVCFDL